MKIFSTQFEKGSLISSPSGTKGTLTPGSGGFRSTSKGMAMKFDGSATKIVYGGIALSGDFSVVSIFKSGDKSGDDLQLIGDNTGNFQPFRIRDNVFKAFINDGSQSTSFNSSTVVTDSKYHLAIFSCDRDGDIVLYIDNEEDVSVANLTVGTITLADLNVGFGAASDYFKGDILSDEIYSHLLSSEERDELWEDFLFSKPTLAIKENVTASLMFKDDDLSNRADLASGYNFQDSINDIDITNKGFDITNTGRHFKTLHGRKYDGVSGKGVIGNLGNIKGFECRIKFDSTTEPIMEGAANDKLIHINAGTLTYPEFDNAIIDGVDSNVIAAGVWHNLVVISSTNVDFTACTIALNNASYGGIEIEDLKFHTETKDLAYGKAYNNRYAKLVILREKFKDLGADEVVKDLLHTVKGTGDFFIGEITTPTALHKAGDNYAECDSNGTLKWRLGKLNSSVEKGFMKKLLFYTGGAWVDYGGVSVDAAISVNDWLSWSNNELVFTCTAGQRIGEFEIQQGGETIIILGTYEDFTTYTEVDSGGFITVAENKLTGAVPETAESYVYKDFGADHFNGDYEMQFQINVASSSEDASLGVLILANDIDDARALDVASKGMHVRVTGATAVDWDLRLALEWQGTSNLVHGMNYATDYYCTVTRDDDAGTSSKGRYVLTVYSDSGRTAVVGTTFVDSNVIQKNWRYLYPMSAYKIGDADIASVVIDNLEIISP